MEDHRKIMVEKLAMRPLSWLQEQLPEGDAGGNRLECANRIAAGLSNQELKNLLIGDGRRPHLVELFSEQHTALEMRKMFPAGSRNKKEMVQQLTATMSTKELMAEVTGLPIQPKPEPASTQPMSAVAAAGTGKKTTIRRGVSPWLFATVLIPLLMALVGIGALVWWVHNQHDPSVLVVKGAKINAPNSDITAPNAKAVKVGTVNGGATVGTVNGDNNIGSTGGSSSGGSSGGGGTSVPAPGASGNTNQYKPDAPITNYGGSNAAPGNNVAGPGSGQT